MIGRAGRHRATPLVAAGVVIALGAVSVVGGAGGAAGASTSYTAQSVGRFLDGSLGGMPLQAIADVKDARAKAPGSQSAQNPLDAKVAGQLEVPIGNALKLPGGGLAHLGAANQVAVAKTTGYAYGASGAVSNSGGVALGGNDAAYPADAKLTISSASLGTLPIPAIPGAAAGAPTSAAALGGVSATIGAVSALAKTKAGGTLVKPGYQIAGLNLDLSSPALAALLGTLTSGGTQLAALLAPIQKALGAAFPTSCSLTNGALPTAPLSLDGGAVTIDAGTGAITVDVVALLKRLGVDVNKLPPNTDLLAYVLNNLGSILSTGLENVISGVVTPIENAGSGCLTALNAIPGVGTTLGTLLGSFTTGEATIEAAVNTVADDLSGSTSTGLAALTSGLAQVVAIGANVQQGGYPLPSEASPKYPFTTKLEATPDQATTPIPGQGVVRALELDLAGAAGSNGVSLALGNAAAGPSAPITVTSTPATSTPPTSTTPTTISTAIPTGVPAGQARPDDGTPALPLVLVLVALAVSAGGVLAFRFRGRQTH